MRKLQYPSISMEDFQKMYKPSWTYRNMSFTKDNFENPNL